MANPAYVTSKEGQNNNPSTTHLVALPPNIVAGQRIVIAFAMKGGHALTWDNATLGAWQEVNQAVEASGSVRLAIFSRIAGAGEGGATLQIGSASADRSAWCIAILSNAATIQAGTAVTNAGVADPDPPNLDLGTSEPTLWLAAMATDGGQQYNTPNEPGGYGRIYSQNSNITGGVGCGLAYRAAAVTAQSENPADWETHQNRRHVAQTLGVRNVNVQQIVAPFMGSSAAFYGGALGKTLFVPFMPSGASFFPATLTYDQTITAPLKASEAQFFGGTMVTATLGVPYMESSAAFFSGVVNVGVATIVAPLMPSGAQFFEGLVTGGARTIPEFDTLEIGPISGSMGDLALYTGSSQGAAFAQRWANRGPVGFGDFAPFVAGEYEFDEAAIWLRLEVETIERVFAITRARVNVDVPDVIDRGAADVPEGGAWISFTRNFYQPPEVVAQVVNAIGVTEAPKVTVRDDIEVGRFFATCHTGDDTANSVAARIKFIATGY